MAKPPKVTFSHFSTLSFNEPGPFLLLAGIYPENPEFPDLLRLNLRVRHPLCRDLIILGVNEMDYLGYNHKWQVYQIIDKDDFEVLEEYHELTAALNDILKI